MTQRIQFLVRFFSMMLLAAAVLTGCASGNSKLKDEICTNGIDDDGDGRIDCLDSDCVLHVACMASTEDCTNGIDDDGDGVADCADADCAASSSCQAGAEICGNGIDDDGDGRIDCADADCASYSGCQTQPENCGNGTDDDGDGFIDCADADCASYSNCQTQPENCANGIDDDGDGRIDCADADCASNAACQGGTCTLNDIFFDSPQTCQTGFICGVDAQLQPACLPSSDFAGGTVYGACGANGECPKGSGCFSDGTTSSCYPFCTDAHPDCPTGGICAYGIEGSDTLYLCAPYDDCDVVGGTSGCAAGQGCYLVSDQGDGLCLTNGTGATGSACTSTLDCRAGNICADPGTGSNICFKLCDGSHPCSSGTCNTNVGLPAGIGACI